MGGDYQHHSYQRKTMSYDENYGEKYDEKYPEHTKRDTTHNYGREDFHGQYPYAYQKVTEHPEGGNYQTHYKQGMYHGSGYYPGGYHGKSHKGQQEYVHNYFKNKFIGDVIGGAVSFDNKPFGYPFDRPIAESAFYAHNIYVKDVYVYHHNDYIPEY